MPRRRVVLNPLVSKLSTIKHQPKSKNQNLTPNKTKKPIQNSKTYNKYHFVNRVYPHGLIREMMHHRNRYHGIDHPRPNWQFETIGCEQLERTFRLLGALEQVYASVGAHEK